MGWNWCHWFTMRFEDYDVAVCHLRWDYIDEQHNSCAEGAD